MIRRHDFNSSWWGGDVGVVEGQSFFELDAAERDALLSPWSWVEASAPLDAVTCARAGAAGFVQIDTQIPFRIGLTRIESSPSVDRLDVRFCDEHPFQVGRGESAEFEHERFAALPGVDAARLANRYVLWATALLDSDPAHGMQVLSNGVVQGWFLGRETERGLELTLAMLATGARISGQLLYHRALLAYRERGVRIGSAKFSVTNTPVHNIYAALGARFLAPVGCWLWASPTA